MSELATQTNAFLRLMASTWGASGRVLRLLYTAVVRSAITTGWPVWRAPPSTSLYQKGLWEELQKVDNWFSQICLWGLQGHASTKPSGRGERTPSAFAP
jgi:hypothetical protein